jgi:hypothetical protein
MVMLETSQADSQKNKLAFDEVTHTYFLDGVKIPSVTTVLQHAGLVGLEDIPRDVLAAKAKIGNEIHKAIEQYEKGKFVSGKVFSVGAWIEFVDLYAFKSVQQEYQVFSSGMRVAGTIDHLGIMPPQRSTSIAPCTVIVDVKTGAKKISDVIQVCAYGLLHPVDRLFILYISGPRYKAVEIKGYDRSKGENIFRSALSLYHYRQKEGLLCQQK